MHGGLGPGRPGGPVGRAVGTGALGRVSSTERQSVVMVGEGVGSLDSWVSFPAASQDGCDYDDKAPCTSAWCCQGCVSCDGSSPLVCAGWSTPLQEAGLEGDGPSRAGMTGPCLSHMRVWGHLGSHNGGTCQGRDTLQGEPTRAPSDGAQQAPSPAPSSALPPFQLSPSFITAVL